MFKQKTVLDYAGPPAKERYTISQRLYALPFAIVVFLMAWFAVACVYRVAFGGSDVSPWVDRVTAVGLLILPLGLGLLAYRRKLRRVARQKNRFT